MYVCYFLSFFILRINLPFKPQIVILFVGIVRSHRKDQNKHKSNMRLKQHNEEKYERTHGAVKWSEVCMCVCVQRLTNAISSIDEIKLKI